MLDKLCTVKEACFTEKCGRTTVYARIKSGHYEAVKIGGSTRLLVRSLEAFRKTFSSKARVAGGSESQDLTVSKSEAPMRKTSNTTLTSEVLRKPAGHPEKLTNSLAEHDPWIITVKAMIHKEEGYE